MYIGQNNDWMRYSSLGNWHLSSIKNCGKWMFYFNSQEFAIEIINKALTDNIVSYAKHTKGDSGICCLYASGLDFENHLRVIDFMIENNLVRLTNNLSYFDTTFKFNSQSWAKEYGNPFEGTIKLSDFINLQTGNQLNKFDLTSKLVYKQQLPNGLKHNQIIAPLYNTTNQYLTAKFNKVLQADLDVNDKFMHIIPITYIFRQVFSDTDNQVIESKVQSLINNYVQTNANSNQLTKLSVNNTQYLTQIQSASNYNQLLTSALFDDQLLQVISYLLYLSIYTTNIEDVQNILDIKKSET